MATKKEGSLSRLIHSLTTDVPSGGVRYETVRSEEKKPFPFRLVIVALVITAMLMAIVFSFIRIARVRSDIERVRGEIEQIEQELEDRERDLEEKYRGVDKDEKASELGMREGNLTRILPRESEKEVTAVLRRDEPKKTGGLFSVIGRTFQALINFIN